ASRATLAAIQDVVDYLGRQPGLRVLVIASGGFLGQTLEAQQDQIIQEALRQRVTINGLDASGLYAGGPGLPLDQQEDVGIAPPAMFAFDESSKMPEHEAMDAAVANLAQSTGGLFFQNNNDLALGFERLGLVASVTYRLSFAPQGLIRNGKLHHLKIEVVPDHGYTIEARRGYFAPPPETPSEDLDQAIDTAMRGRREAQQFPATVAAVQDGKDVAIAIHVDLAKLKFHREKSRERNQLVITVGLYQAGGRFVSGKQAEMSFALKPTSWRMLRQRGLSVHLKLPAEVGLYTLRTVVAVSNGGRLDAMSQRVAVN
ncbi:MAG: VWA domain-containing protein, partial [Terriglobales bacterium]